MKRWGLMLLTALLLTGGTPFDKKLSKDQQIVHVLNRMTFGARPGDVDEVRRLGVDKWIQQQLHPERMQENPVLEAKLKPLETLEMSAGDIMEQYKPMQFMAFRTQLNQLLQGDQTRKLYNGTAEERMALVKSLDADKRKQVLAQAPQNLFANLPELQKEAEEARKAQQEEFQKENRKRNPPLSDLLNADQMMTATRGNSEQLAALFAYLDPVKRKQVAAALPPQALTDFPELRRVGMKQRQPNQVVSNDLREGKIYRAVYSNRQLEEVLADFWFNHFNVYENKAQDRFFLSSYEREAIRPHVLGKFKDLLLATARHPAMLYYLDNWESISSDALEVGPFAGPPQIFAQQLQRQAHGINENYGREVMELHTLGVNGGYTQDDVIAVAKCFTGWTIRQPNTKPEFVFAPFMHDYKEKVVLGHKIPAGGGESDGLAVIDILAHHPSTAKFISRKLAQRFVADDPPQSLIDKMAQAFTKTDGDLRAVLETMFFSPEFGSEGAWQTKIKSPLELVVSAVRATGSDVNDAFTLGQRVADLGEPLYNKLEPTGYSNTGEGWLSTSGLLGRMNFATALVSGQMAGVKVKGERWDGKDADSIARDVLGRDASGQTQEAIAKGLDGNSPTPRQLAGLVLSSPDFQRR
jgi:uncharacterized protein (DUF1800 family)